MKNILDKEQYTKWEKAQMQNTKNGKNKKKGLKKGMHKNK